MLLIQQIRLKTENSTKGHQQIRHNDAINVTFLDFAEGQKLEIIETAVNLPRWRTGNPTLTPSSAGARVK
jgi:hypothetical protein